MHNEKTFLYRLETTFPLAGRGEKLTLNEWRRVYGYPNMLLGRGRLVRYDEEAEIEKAANDDRYDAEGVDQFSHSFTLSPRK